MISYEAKFSVDVGQAIPAIGDLFNRINAHLATDGYEEQLKCHAPVFTLAVSVNRELTKDEQNLMKTTLQEAVSKHMSKYDIRLVDFRRKSGNVSQSVVQ